MEAVNCWAIWSRVRPGLTRSYAAASCARYLIPASSMRFCETCANWSWSRGRLSSRCAIHSTLMPTPRNSPSKSSRLHTNTRTFFLTQRTVASTGNRRPEVHRSLAEYGRAFKKVGLKVDEVLELDGTDTRLLRPASDHLVFRLSPWPEPVPRVSLLIKTCLMEWKIIERLVRHQVGQLEWPVGFVESIVVVDPSEGRFSRQYEEVDADAHRAAIDRLVEDGVVDRVVYAPQDPAIIRSTYRKWFGVESDKTHSTNGPAAIRHAVGFRLLRRRLRPPTGQRHAYLEIRSRPQLPG